jgi:hypothetical protein
MARSAALVRAAAALLASVLSVLSVLSAQAPPPGWSTPVRLTESAQAPAVRAVWQLRARAHVLAVRGQLYYTGSGLDPANMPHPLADLGPADDWAFLCPTGTPHRAYAGALKAGTIHVVDARYGVVSQFPGVVNTFDAVAVGGDLLLSANPLWPQPGAISGLWLAGPGRTPRQLMPLSGPSGPLVVLSNGDLVLAELGPVVPPPPGAARLLRFPAAKVQAAIAGGTLSMADVTATGNGFTSLYDLACDGEGRIHATDANGSVVVHTAPGGLTPVGVTLDAGPGRFVVGLQYEPHGTAPLRGYQPPNRSPSLLVGTTDFWSLFELLELQPSRPSLTISPSTDVAPGSSSLAVGGAPPNGFALALASLPWNAAEFAVVIDGTPLWLGVSPATVIVITSAIADPNGNAALALINPGGIPGPIDLQVVALGAAGTGELGSSPALRLLLLP